MRDDLSEKRRSRGTGQLDHQILADQSEVAWYHHRLEITGARLQQPATTGSLLDQDLSPLSEQFEVALPAAATNRGNEAGEPLARNVV